MIQNQECWHLQKETQCVGKEEVYWPAYLHLKICGLHGQNITNKKIKSYLKKLSDHKYFFCLHKSFTKIDKLFSFFT